MPRRKARFGSRGLIRPGLCTGHCSDPSLRRCARLPAPILLAKPHRQALRTARTAGCDDLMQTTLYRLLPRTWRQSANPARLIMATQFIRFGVVGVVGLIVDTATVYGLRHALGVYGAGLVAYVTAASSNWLLNRIWTFRGQGSGSAHRQWARFMVTNLAGFVLNRGTYAALVTFMPAAAEQPIIAIAAGAIAGLLVNFNLSRRHVFR
jgi:putative flippase GtrA